jgi:hypothetical protein
VAQKAGASIDVRHIPQDPGPQRQRIKRQAVTPESGFGLRPTHQVIPGVLGQITARARGYLLQSCKFVQLNASSSTGSAWAALPVSLILINNYYRQQTGHV